MKDLFENIETQSNGAFLVRNCAFTSSVNTIKRDKCFEEVMKNASLPKANEILAVKSNGVSDVGSIYSYIAEREIIEEAYISTWIISRENIDRLKDDLDSGVLESMYFALSTRLKQLKKSNYAYFVESMKDRSNVRFKVLNNHAKVFSLKTKNGNHYTVNGSGNWTKNPRIEFYTIHNSVELFQFNKEWIKELL